MLVIDTNCGLGNQLFHYAYARALSEKLDVPFAMYNDPNNYGENPSQHIVGFRHLNVKDFEIITDISALDKVDGEWCYIAGCNHNSEVMPLPKTENIFFLRSKRNYRIFDFMKEKLRNELKVKTPPSPENAALLEELKRVNSVAVHVRYYFDEDGTATQFAACGDDYYKKAVEIIKENVENPIFYIFCLDMDKCKREFKIDGEMVFVDTNNPVHEDFRLMYSCKHIIAAASTLSWWAVYVHENRKGIRISPEQEGVFEEYVQTAAPPDCITLPNGNLITYENL